jgi:hypothetical protein
LTLVWNCVAIDDSVSPVLTVHLTCPPPFPDEDVVSAVVAVVSVVVVVVAEVVVAVVDVVDWLVVAAVVTGFAFAVVTGSGAIVVAAGSGGGGVCGTESVCAGPAGAFDGGGPPSAVCPRTPVLERIIMIAVTAASNAAGAM